MRLFIRRLVESQWFRERVLGEQYLSIERVHEAFWRCEMDSHPWDRREPWHGMDEAHWPVGTKVLPFSLSKRRMFGPRRQAS